MGPDTTDAALLRAWRAGSEEAARLLHDRYAERLRRLARVNSSAALAGRVEADDIVQSVFRRFFQAAARGAYDLPTSDDLWSLLMVIALNRVRLAEDFHRAARRSVRRTVPTGLDEERLAAPPDADGLVRLVLDEALDRLPANYRRAIELRMQGHEIADIARITNRSQRTTERALQDARSMLRGLLDEEEA
ncbi:MAG: sigma-70 family RNA polymerase sigma factor [Gemmataceae bacterium]|nr:sigma-70 family RNA polymerase sigma factor [Gemmataceae bacterium]